MRARLSAALWLLACVSAVGADEGVILTPKPGPAPRINGARVFGARPGSPFLFTVAATGERPIRFAAEGLPGGLRLDPATGRISGSVAVSGTHAVTLTATNRHGTATRPFRIVIGDTLALTPHMGWNSWYVWENHVTDRIMRQAAEAIVSSGLADHGYQIYTGPGPRTCAGHVGAYQHEEQDAARFVEWGFDFLKYDWCSYGEIAGKDPSVEALQKPYRQMGAILKRQPRDVVLNLCQYGMGKVWEWGSAVGGQSWRTAGDLGLTFEGIGTALFKDGFDVYADNNLHRFGGPGAWNDPDYLLLGYLSNWKGATAKTPLTPNEQYTHLSLWSLVAAPLIFSGDVTRLDPFTLSLLTNDEVIDVDQDPLGRPGRRVFRQGPLEVWARELEDGSLAVGLFNRGEGTVEVAAAWTDLGVSGKQTVRDLWRQKQAGVFEGRYAAPVGRHGVALVKLTPTR
jgi:alpha-galactosidase